MIAIPIPATDVTLQAGVTYQLTGLTASTKYTLTVSSDKFCEVLVTTDVNENPTVLAQGQLYNAPFTFTEPAAQTTARITVYAPTGANLKLTGAATPATPAAVDLVAPALPNTAYKKTGLTVGKTYVVQVSGNTPSCVGLGWQGGTELEPLIATNGKAIIVAEATQLNLWLDSAESATITVTEATSLPPCYIPTVTVDLAEATKVVSLPAGSPAGLYRVDISVDDKSATAHDSTITATPTNSILLNSVLGYADAGGYMAPSTLAAGVISGVSDMKGSLVITSPYQVQATTVLTYKPATGATGWSGKAIVSYLGPIS